MSEFDNLPDELVEFIFGYLLPDEKLNATLVCKRFNRIIGNSIELMSHIALKIDINKTDISGLQFASRKYVNLIVECKSQNSPQKPFRDLIEKLCSNVKFIKFTPVKNCSSMTFPDIFHRRILKSSKKLQSLEWVGARSRWCGDTPSWTVSLPNLRHINVTDSVFDPSFIEDFDKLTKLTSIKLDDLDFGKFNPRELILRQTELQHLEIGCFFINEMDDEFVRNFKVQLKSLEIKFDIRNFDKAIKLLNTQHNLRELAVLPINPNLNPALDEIALLDCIFNKKTVRKLSINYPRDCYGDIYRHRNCSQIEELRVYFLQNTEVGLTELQKLLEIMPNVKTLHFSTSPRNDRGTFDENDIQFLNKLEHLENLYIGVSKSPNAVQFLDIKNLKRFAIDSYYKLSSQESQATKIMTGAVWLPFLRRHPKLMELNVSNLLLSKYLWNYIDTQHPGLKIVNIDVNNIR